MTVVFVIALALLARAFFFNQLMSELPFFNANNNPTNLRPSSTNAWLGQVGISRNNFSIFKSSEWGFRAAHINLESYLRNGYTTIEQIINRWAPSSDNNPTSQYIENVYAWTKIPRGKVISRADLPLLLSAITRQETSKVVSPQQIKKAIKSVGYEI